MSVIDITTKRKQQTPANIEIIQKSEHIKFMTVQMILNAFETMGLTEVERGYWWLHNTLNNAIRGFFEHSIGVMNVPPETKKEAAARIKEESEKLKKSKAVRVNKNKTFREAKAIIIKISEKRNEQTQKKKPCTAPTVTGQADKHLPNI